MSKKKFNFEERKTEIKKQLSEAGNYIIDRIIAVLQGLDYTTYEISSKGGGYIGKITIQGKTYHVNRVFYDFGTKSVVFKTIEENFTPNSNEFFVESDNFNNYTEKEIKSFIGMLRTYLKSGNVYGYDTKKHTETSKVVRQNNVKYDSLNGNFRLIDTFINKTK